MPCLLLLLLLSIAISACLGGHFALFYAQQNKAEGNFQVPFLHNYPVLHMPRKRSEATQLTNVPSRLSPYTCELYDFNKVKRGRRRRQSATGMCSMQLILDKNVK